MISELASGTTHVRRLRLRGRGFKPLSAQRRAEAALNACRFGELDLPESAILCIKTFRDPLPGTLRLHGAVAGDNSAWQRAASAAFGAIVRRAPRPAVEPTPSD